jgi:hypothetical protein
MKLRITPAGNTELGQEPAIRETDRAGREEDMPTCVAILDQPGCVVSRSGSSKNLEKSYEEKMRDQGRGGMG